MHEKVIDYLDDGSQNLFLFAYRRETVYGSIDFDDTYFVFSIHAWEGSTWNYHTRILLTQYIGWYKLIAYLYT